MKFHDEENESEDDDDLYEDLPNSRENNNATNAKDSVVFDSAVSDLDYLRSKMRKMKDDDEEEEDGDEDEESGESNRDKIKKEEEKEEEQGVEPTPSARKITLTTPTTTAIPNGQNRNKNNNNSIPPSSPFPSASSQQEVNVSRLFVRNLSYATTEEHLLQVFSRFGEIEEIHIPLNREMNSPRGIAFVLFKNPGNIHIWISI